MKLVYEKTGLDVKVGDNATTFRGESVVVRSIEKPRHGGSTGRVYFEDGLGGVFPSVIDAKWIDRDDQ